MIEKEEVSIGLAVTFDVTCIRLSDDLRVFTSLLELRYTLLAIAYPSILVFRQNLENRYGYVSLKGVYHYYLSTDLTRAKTTVVEDFLV